MPHPMSLGWIDMENLLRELPDRLIKVLFLCIRLKLGWQIHRNAGLHSNIMTCWVHGFSACRISGCPPDQ